MTIENWLAFVAASTIMLLIPGPTVTLVTSYALAEGRRAALVTVEGVILGDLTAIAFSFAALASSGFKNIFWGRCPRQFRDSVPPTLKVGSNFMKNLYL